MGRHRPEQVIGPVKGITGATAFEGQSPMVVGKSPSRLYLQTPTVLCIGTGGAPATLAGSHSQSGVPSPVDVYGTACQNRRSTSARNNPAVNERFTGLRHRRCR